MSVWKRMLLVAAVCSAVGLFVGSSGTNVGDRAGMTCGFSLLVNGFGVGGEGG